MIHSASFNDEDAYFDTSSESTASTFWAVNAASFDEDEDAYSEASEGAASTFWTVAYADRFANLCEQANADRNRLMYLRGEYYDPIDAAAAAIAKDNHCTATEKAEEAHLCVWMLSGSSKYSKKALLIPAAKAAEITAQTVLSVALDNLAVANKLADVCMEKADSAAHFAAFCKQANAGQAEECYISAVAAATIATAVARVTTYFAAMAKDEYYIVKEEAKEADSYAWITSNSHPLSREAFDIPTAKADATRAQTALSVAQHDLEVANKLANVYAKKATLAAKRVAFYQQVNVDRNRLIYLCEQAKEYYDPVGAAASATAAVRAVKAAKFFADIALAEYYTVNNAASAAESFARMMHADRMASINQVAAARVANKKAQAVLKATVDALEVANKLAVVCAEDAAIKEKIAELYPPSPLCWYWDKEDHVAGVQPYTYGCVTVGRKWRFVCSDCHRWFEENGNHSFQELKPITVV